MSGKGTLKHVGVGVLVAATVALGATFVVAEAAIDEDAAQRHIDEAKAYCELAHGSDELYNANVWGNHGGLHCMAHNGDGPHFHDVPDWAKKLAYQIQYEGVEADWEAAEQQVTSQWEDRPWYETGIWPLLLTAGTLALLLALMAAAIRYAPMGAV